jgi:peptide/nickel transport system substrate-binding protein
MHWRNTNNFAHIATRSDLHLHPEHIVRPLWEAGDVDHMLAQPFFQQGFVGLGPYRIDRWESDGTIVFKRFEDFFLGPPRIGTIVHHSVSSALNVLTLLLAGSIHRTSRNGLGFEEGMIAKEQWEAKGEGTVYFVPVGFRRLLLPQDSNPLFRDARLRRALLMAVDREQLVSSLYSGQAKVAHIALAPNEPGFAAAEAASTKHPFDPRGALALLEQSGWRRGTDGVLANAAGERLEIPFRVPVGDAEQVRMQGAVAGFWSDIGIRVRVDNATDAQLRDRQERETFPGVSATDSGPTIASLSRRWHTRQIPNQQNRYTGDNVAHWSHPEVDRILGEIDNTFRAQEMERHLVEFSRIFADELPVVPLYYTPEVTAAHKFLKGARPRPAGSGQNTWNWSAYQWEWTGP